VRAVEERQRIPCPCRVAARREQLASMHYSFARRSTKAGNRNHASSNERREQRAAYLARQQNLTGIKYPLSPLLVPFLIRLPAELINCIHLKTLINEEGRSFVFA